ncbi:4Fe-4S cluster-binding domain-containing protein [Thiocapsa roseopersicina]|uniref:Anaerobic ribonucleoside-triphosphate reductase activating protein n=1 Tax=Thiocapsa roseopersicina TaxID=1058 RepID=A0A1H2Y9F2_THIRO|nr:4Fe-4S cluster-binding domain-containing protein [Thiocapsa roseopersicina]SDX01448.1 anaerobic ribonucleoside-triphosphate reductase activating protein [Thiocapsa roseopersicina]
MPPALHLYATVPRSRALGPRSRYGLWVQGCPFRCSGCMTPGALPFTGGTAVDLDALTAEVLAVPDIEGLTVSGGEPFAQASALAALLMRLRARRDLGLIVYTGFRHGALRRRARTTMGIAALLAATDLLIDGPYQALRNDGAPLRGSANQRVITLTDRYRNQLQEYAPGQPRAVEVHVGIGERLLVGIPSDRQLSWWQVHKTGAARR